MVKSKATEADDYILSLAICGLVLGVMGAWATIATWPEDDGSDISLLTWLTLGGFGVSQMLLLIALVAWGVRLGIQAAGLAKS